MNLPLDWVVTLQEAGLEAVHWSSVGPIRAPDGEIMNFAERHSFVVLTHDLDFGTLLAASSAIKPSVVQIRADDIFPYAIGVQAVTALHDFEDELSRGALVTVDPRRTRLRMLPFGFKGKESGEA